MHIHLGCLQLSWVGDRYCDDDTNTIECNFDGGDCCGPDVKTELCTDCQCIGMGDKGTTHI